jgi:hypothetical protein
MRRIGCARLPTFASARILGATLLIVLSATTASAGAWYLLEPPLSPKLHATDEDPRAWAHVTDAPFSHWYMRAAFETAKTCAAERGRVIKDEQWVSRETPGTGENEWWQSFLRASHAAIEASECVAAGDRRMLR